MSGRPHSRHHCRCRCPILCLCLFCLHTQKNPSANSALDFSILCLSLVAHHCGLHHWSSFLSSSEWHPVVDRFSKSTHFVVLSKLPTAKKSADSLVEHVFHLYGLISIIVSDRGHQFIYQAWKAFCTALGATTSVSFGFHPQSNGYTVWIN